ncbi:DUF2061 domain-containing protein [Hoeflea olei]|uniref:DUF2061 domain-containing protein n=1 Tax=Hoeflea olei TaxID=1480615 RepID=A0A1C1YZY2_9HYPH|nr:DUF2061 domain-containing protein [Hoeflea olei]OCW59037.1 hypothetical protein AWJ14_04855 [Hoeflea olei]
MDSPVRTIVKAVSWQALGLVSTALIAWLHTGAMLSALTFALSTSATGLAFFFLHERLWARVRWGLGEARAEVEPQGR